MSLPAGARAVTFICTRDRKAAMAFYGGVLGLPLVKEDPFAATYDVFGAPMRLSDVQGFTPHPHTALGWSVPDMTKAVKALQAKGVTFAIYEGFGQDKDGVWTAPGGKVKIVWFNDPDGNALSLTEGGA
jgi:catechol 2,3-dioxygenase-like lactoylglutathione lyase family enzyme